MACGMALMCASLSASANIRYDDPQEEVQKKEVPNPEKAAQRRTDEMDKALNLTEKQYKKIYKLFLKEEKEKVENMMQRHPGGMNGQPPMGGRPPMGGGRPPMGGEVTDCRKQPSRERTMWCAFLWHTEWIRSMWQPLRLWLFGSYDAVRTIENTGFILRKKTPLRLKKT